MGGVAGTSDSGYLYGATREERGIPVSHRAAHREPPLYYGLPVRGLDRVPTNHDSRTQEHYPQPHASPSHRPRAEPASSSPQHPHQNPNSASAPSPRQQTRAAAATSSASRLFSWLHNVPGVDEMRQSLRRVYLSQQHAQGGSGSHSHAPMHEPPRVRPTNVFESSRSPANPFVAAAQLNHPQAHNTPRPRSPRLFSIRSRGASHEGVREALEELLGGLAAEEGVDVTMEEIAPDGLLGLDPHLVTPTPRSTRPEYTHDDTDGDDAAGPPPPYDINAPVTVCAQCISLVCSELCSIRSAFAVPQCWFDSGADCFTVAGVPWRAASAAAAAAAAVVAAAFAKRKLAPRRWRVGAAGRGAAVRGAAAVGGGGGAARGGGGARTAGEASARAASRVRRRENAQAAE